MHDHEYDDGGRLVRTVVTREPEWDEDERAFMLGLADREAAECRRCGGDLKETLDYSWRWVPQPPAVCLRCVALDEVEKAHSKHPQRAGLIHHVKRALRPKPRQRHREV